MPEVRRDFGGEVLEHGLVADVAGVIAAGQQVYDANLGAIAAKLLRNAFAYALRAAGDDGDLVLEHGCASYIIIPSQWSISCWMISAVQPVKVLMRS